jgi:(E)-2-((N-methylformamido)methylene)succinate hydrolase
VISREVLGRGTDLLLLHGVGLDREMWRRCVPALAASHQVQLIDLPGHGRSGTVSDPAFSLADLTAEVAELLEGPTHVVGYSLGALVAQDLALTFPDRVCSLTLLSSVARRSDEQRAAVRGRLDGAAQDFEATCRASVERWFSADWRAAEPRLVDQVLATLLSNDRTSYLRCYQIFASADAALWPKLGRISAPTLVATGENDTGSTPAMTAALAAAIPGAESMVVPEAGHLLPLERPREVAEAVLSHTLAVDRSRGIAASPAT